MPDMEKLAGELFFPTNQQLFLVKKKVLPLVFSCLQDTFSCLLASYKFGPLDANHLASTFCWLLFHNASTDFANLLADRPAPRRAARGCRGVEPPLLPRDDF